MEWNLKLVFFFFSGKSGNDFPTLTLGGVRLWVWAKHNLSGKRRLLHPRSSSSSSCCWFVVTKKGDNEANGDDDDEADGDDDVDFG